MGRDGGAEAAVPAKAKLSPMAAATNAAKRLLERTTSVRDIACTEYDMAAPNGISTIRLLLSNGSCASSELTSRRNCWAYVALPSHHAAQAAARRRA
jgi:hypothetical protein